MNKTSLLLGVYACICLSACHSTVEEKQEEGNYSVTSPIQMDTSYSKDYVAEIQSIQNIEVRAKVDGYLESINVDEGQHVSAGQLLFTIRPREYEAELAKAKAETKTAELEMQNVKVLADKNIVSQNELAMAVAKLDQAKAEQAIAELHLSYTEIRAPFDGIIDRIHFKVGSLIDNGGLLTTLSNNKEVFAYFNVSEAEYLDFKAQHGDNVKDNVTLILANGQEHKFKGTIETIEGEFDREVGNISFRARFPNPDLLLKHGETGKVRLNMGIHNALIIPQKATYDIQDKTFAYVLDKDNVVRSKEISVLQKLSNIYVIGNELNASDKILLEGLQSVKEGDTIHAVFNKPKEVIDHLQLIAQKK